MSESTVMFARKYKQVPDTVTWDLMKVPLLEVPIGARALDQLESLKAWLVHTLLLPG